MSEGEIRRMTEGLIEEEKTELKFVCDSSAPVDPFATETVATEAKARFAGHVTFAAMGTGGGCCCYRCFCCLWFERKTKQKQKQFRYTQSIQLRRMTQGIPLVFRPPTVHCLRYYAAEVMTNYTQFCGIECGHRFTSVPCCNSNL